jgi:cardiolipin synthase (CMP-forming)
VTRLLPDGVSASRFALAPAVVWSLSTGQPALAFAALALAGLTDVVDGRLARRLGTQSTRGALLDVTADVAVLLGACAALAALGALPPWLPLVLMAMFARFLVAARCGGSPYDPVGRHVGTVLYVGVLTLVAVPDAALAWALTAAVVVMALGSLVARELLRRAGGDSQRSRRVLGSSSSRATPAGPRGTTAPT